MSDNEENDSRRPSHLNDDGESVGSVGRNTSHGSDGEGSPRLGARHNKKRSLRVQRPPKAPKPSSRPKSTAPKVKKSKPTSRKSYVDRDALEEDDEGNLISSDEEEEEEEEEEDNEMEGFIADEEEEEAPPDDIDGDSDSSDDDGRPNKRLRRAVDLDEDKELLRDNQADGLFDGTGFDDAYGPFLTQNEPAPAADDLVIGEEVDEEDEVDEYQGDFGEAISAYNETFGGTSDDYYDPAALGDADLDDLYRQAFEAVNVDKKESSPISKDGEVIIEEEEMKKSDLHAMLFLEPSVLERFRAENAISKSDEPERMYNYLKSYRAYNKFIASKKKIEDDRVLASGDSTISFLSKLVERTSHVSMVSYIVSNLTPSLEETISNPYSDRSITMPTIPASLSADYNMLLESVSIAVVLMVEKSFEPTYIHVYERDRVGDLSLDMLWAILDLAVKFALLSYKRVFIALLVQRYLDEGKISAADAEEVNGYLLTCESIRESNNIFEYLRFLVTNSHFSSFQVARSILFGENSSVLAARPISNVDYENLKSTYDNQFTKLSDQSVVNYLSLFLRKNPKFRRDAEWELLQNSSLKTEPTSEDQFRKNVDDNSFGLHAFDRKTLRDFGKLSYHRLSSRGSDSVRDALREPVGGALLSIVDDEFPSLSVSLEYPSVSKTPLPLSSLENDLKSGIDSLGAKVRNNTASQLEIDSYYQFQESLKKLISIKSDSTLFYDFYRFYRGFAASLLNSRVVEISVPTRSTERDGRDLLTKRRVRMPSRVGGLVQALELYSSLQENKIRAVVNVLERDYESVRLRFAKSIISEAVIREVTSSIIEKRPLNLPSSDPFALVDTLRLSALDSAMRHHSDWVKALTIERLQVIGEQAAVGEYACALRRLLFSRPPEPPAAPLRRVKSRVGGELSSPLPPWVSKRYRIVVAIPARVDVVSADTVGIRDRSLAREHDVLVSVDANGHLLEFLTLSSLTISKEQRPLAIAAFLASQNPDLVVLSTRSGPRKTRDMRRELLACAAKADDLVHEARLKEKARNALMKSLRERLKSKETPGAFYSSLDKQAIASATDEEKAALNATYFGLEVLDNAMKPWLSGGVNMFHRPRHPLVEVRTRTAPDGSQTQISSFNEEKGSFKVVHVFEKFAEEYVSRGKKEHPELTESVLFGLSLARFAQDPVAEVAFMYSSVGDGANTEVEKMLAVKAARDLGCTSVTTNILNVSLIPEQHRVSGAALLVAAERVICEAVAAQGVDINFIRISYGKRKTHLYRLLDFVPGLGPARARDLLGDLVHSPRVIMSREMLAEEPIFKTSESRRENSVASFGIFGPVAQNALGFIKVTAPSEAVLESPSVPKFLDPTHEMSTNTASYLSTVFDKYVKSGEVPERAADLSVVHFNPLDSTRIHPSDYPMVLSILNTIQFNPVVNPEGPGTNSMNVEFNKVWADIDADLRPDSYYEQFLERFYNTYSPTVQQVQEYWETVVSKSSSARKSFDAGDVARYVEVYNRAKILFYIQKNGMNLLQCNFGGPTYDVVHFLFAQGRNALFISSEKDLDYIHSSPFVTLQQNLISSSAASSSQDPYFSIEGLPSHNLSRRLQRLRFIAIPELFAPFSDARRPHVPPEPAALLALTVGATSADLRMGLTVEGTVTKITNRFLSVRLDGFRGLEGSISARRIRLPPGDEDLGAHFRLHQGIRFVIVEVNHTQQYFEGSLLEEDLRQLSFPLLDAHANLQRVREIQAAAEKKAMAAVTHHKLSTGGTSVAEIVALHAAEGKTLSRAIESVHYVNESVESVRERLSTRPLFEALLFPSRKGPYFLNLLLKVEEFKGGETMYEVHEEDKDPKKVNAIGGKLRVLQELLPGRYEYSSIDDLFANFVDKIGKNHERLRKDPRYTSNAADDLTTYLKKDFSEKRRPVYAVSPNSSKSTKIGHYIATYYLGGGSADFRSFNVFVLPDGYYFEGKVVPDVNALISELKKVMAAALQQRKMQTSNNQGYHQQPHQLQQQHQQPYAQPIPGLSQPQHVSRWI